MKKLFTILFCLLTMTAAAEEMKMALLQPRVAEGSDPADLSNEIWFAASYVKPLAGNQNFKC